MSMLRAKGNLQDLIADREVKVMALSGKWGTGKSHMWDSLRKASTDSHIQGALYVSLFGVATIAELKLKLAQSAVPMIKKNGPQADAVKGAMSAIKNGAQGFFKLGTALDEFALLAVPAMVREKFIVVDDIERKHEKLTIDEVLGFIDDFTRNYGCRILLILNTDQLADRTVWEKFREKVIDEELRLDTTAAEAFDIAIQLSQSPFASKIKPAVEACGISNIRIIRKVIRAANKILAAHLTLPDDVLDRVIPSTVLLSAIHYKGIDDGPTMAFVLDSHSDISRQIAQRERERRGEEASDEDKLHARWMLLLNGLGIADTDEYEKLVSDYLNAGLVDRSAVDSVVGRYCHERQRAGAQARVREFFQSTIWDPELMPAQIVEAAGVLLADVPHVDCYSVSSLHDYLVEFQGGAAIAEQMVSLWVDQLKEMAAAPGADPREFVLDNWTGRALHPSIMAAFAEARVRVEQPRTLLDVCLFLAKSNGWNPSEEAVMQAATVDDFVRTILSIRGQQLKVFLLKNLDIYANRGTYAQHFGSGPQHFLEACKRIRVERAGTRWASLIEDLFKGAKLDTDLNVGQPAAGTTASDNAPT
ncbi:hypothetical protein RBA41_02320 [Massilia sp. CCM 9210]|uniref:hypothetical protein n=1 Tax=Massilia scottii TaxID=3057166 RepID=UPI002796B495|nr:hypothetical protein [Massilia sp. CCM 9210]MDQ1812128.1 hypothetical protein [Massilia sp. CCM 9210]